MSTNPSESMFRSLIRHSEQNITRAHGSTLLHCWLRVVLQNYERQFKPVKTLVGRAQIVVTIKGFVEGLNNKIRVIQRRAYGYRDEGYR